MFSAQEGTPLCRAIFRQFGIVEVGTLGRPAVGVPAEAGLPDEVAGAAARPLIGVRLVTCRRACLRRGTCRAWWAGTAGWDGIAWPLFVGAAAWAGPAGARGSARAEPNWPLAKLIITTAVIADARSPPAMAAALARNLSRLSRDPARPYMADATARGHGCIR